MKSSTKFALVLSCLGALAATPAMAESHEMSQATQEKTVINMFGGPAYLGEPALDVTAALVKAGGGAENFSFAAALVSMLGEDTVNAEVKKLTEQYGEEEVNSFIGGMDFAINASLKRATEKGIALPEPAALAGVELAKTLVNAGIAPDGKWWSGYLFDVAISHDLHNIVMADINAGPGYNADKVTHKVLNQAMYDVAQALGIKAELADLH